MPSTGYAIVLVLKCPAGVAFMSFIYFNVEITKALVSLIWTFEIVA